MAHFSEIQALIETLRPFYADVRLMSAENIRQLQERSLADLQGLDLCYACTHNLQTCRHCAAISAFETRSVRFKLEYFEPDIVQMEARYLEIDGEPYVLALTRRVNRSDMLESDNGEHLISMLTDYNSKLYHDALTGVYNRRYYEDNLRSHPGPAGVAILDLDDFKIYNDTYGHHGGDVALETAVEVVRRNIRQSDFLVRFGGDEFLLVLPRISSEVFESKLNRIRSEVFSASVPGFPHLHLSVSIGGVIQRERETMDEAVRRADLLMYQGKEQKNRVLMENVSAENTASSPLPEKNEKPQVLIVDDSAINRAILSDILLDDFRILEADSGEQCFTQLEAHPGDVALVLLDLVMPGMDGFEVLRRMNHDHLIEDVPVIMISSEDSDEFIRRAYEMGASDYVGRPFDARVVYQRVFNTIKLYAKQRRLISLVSDQIRRRERNISMMVGVLSQIVEFRNGESALHVQRIRVLTESILEWLASHPEYYPVTASDRDLIPLASALHDIGKVGIDDKILNKPGPLTPEEFNVIKTHTTLGARMLKALMPYYPDEPLLPVAYEITRWHHERWDGRGYPDQLEGDKIPLSAQVVSLADVYDALTSERCYKRAYTHAEAIQMILRGECGAFNPVLLQCLQEIEGSFQTLLDQSFGLLAPEGAGEALSFLESPDLS